MVITLLATPFDDPARQRQFELLEAALQAQDSAPATVLLGNLATLVDLEADALVVRATGVALLVLTPQAGHLTIPALGYGPWLLNGEPVPSRLGADNPFMLYQQQQAKVIAWLVAQLGQPAAELPCCGLALFDSPLSFGPEAEGHLYRWVAARQFELLGGGERVPTWLNQQFATTPALLPEDDLLDWAEHLAGHPPLPSVADPPYLVQKLRQLWRWVGAEDIPADPPYGGIPAQELALRDQREQARLLELRQEVQAELTQHRQEAALREAAHTQQLVLLRQQLQASPPVAPSPAAAQAQVALEASMHAVRADLTARTHELDARLRQLGQLLQALQAATLPATSSAAATTPRRQPVRPIVRPRTPPQAVGSWYSWSSYRPLRQAERWVVVGLAVALLGGGGWGIGRLLQSRTGQLPRAAARHAAVAAVPATHRPDPVLRADTLGDEGTDAAPPREAGIPEEPISVSAETTAPARSPSVDTTASEAEHPPVLPGDTTAVAPGVTP